MSPGTDSTVERRAQSEGPLKYVARGLCLKLLILATVEPERHGFLITAPFIGLGVDDQSGIPERPKRWITTLACRPETPTPVVNRLLICPAPGEQLVQGEAY